MRLALGVVLLCSLATAAAAQPGNTPPTLPSPGSYQPAAPYPPPPLTGTRTERYGSTIALVDGLSMAAIVVGAIVIVGEVVTDGSSDGSAGLGAALMIGGVAGYVVGGPLIHHSKHNDSAAWTSLGLRLGLPVLAGILGAALRDESNPDDDAGASFAGIAVAGAMVIDWVFLAKHEVRF
jgi:hypothetical protein